MAKVRCAACHTEQDVEDQATAHYCTVCGQLWRFAQGPVPTVNLSPTSSVEIVASADVIVGGCLLTAVLWAGAAIFGVVSGDFVRNTGLASGFLLLGLCVVAWSVYVFVRASRHSRTKYRRLYAGFILGGAIYFFAGWVSASSPPMP